MRPRRAQASITIRSDRVAEQLKLFTKSGRSQAEVIEEAMNGLTPPRERMASLDERRARIIEILDQIDPSCIPTMAEFDALEYDEYGNPR